MRRALTCRLPIPFAQLISDADVLFPYAHLDRNRCLNHSVHLSNEEGLTRCLRLGLLVSQL